MRKQKKKFLWIWLERRRLQREPLWDGYLSVAKSLAMRHEGGYIYWIILMSRHDHNNSNCSFLWRRQWHPTPVLLPGTSHGQRSLVGCSPWGREESDTTEQLHFQFSLSCIGEGKWQPTPVFLPGESQGRGSLVGCHLWGHTESNTTEAT